MSISDFAYVSGLGYPHSAAHALQTLRMASAIAHHVARTRLYVRRLGIPEREIRRQYGLAEADPLIIRNMQVPLLSDHAGFYNTRVAARWVMTRPPQVVMVRHRHEFWYWGQYRHRWPRLRQTCFVYEAHDIPSTLRGGDTVVPEHSAHLDRTRRALPGFDLVLTVTRGLADDLRSLTAGQVAPINLPLCTGLPRLAVSPTLTPPGKHIRLGYVGTLDPSHGLDDVFKALLQLPERFSLSIVGRVKDSDKAWLETWLKSPSLNGRIEHASQIPYREVPAAIDRCDIVLAPAGETLHSHRYRSPLKIFDYMARGKPIVAANVPAHREILTEGVTGFLYQAGQSDDLASCLRNLPERHEVLQAVAVAAWRESARYTYDERARRLLALVEEKRKP